MNITAMTREKNIQLYVTYFITKIRFFFLTFPLNTEDKQFQLGSQQLSSTSTLLKYV